MYSLYPVLNIPTISCIFLDRLKLVQLTFVYINLRMIFSHVLTKSEPKISLWQVNIIYTEKDFIVFFKSKGIIRAINALYSTVFHV